MSECGTDIVNCLRKKNIEPSAHSSSWNSEYNGLPENALNYTKDNIFHSARDDDEQWWKVDFKRRVTFYSYQIQTRNYCAFIKKWNISISVDNTTWKIIDTPPEEETFPNGKNYTLKHIYSARYFRINKLQDSAHACAQAFALVYIMFFGSINSVSLFRMCTKCRMSVYRYNIILFMVLCF